MNISGNTHLDLSARQTQQQQLSAKQLQTLELLALSVQSLEARLMENPLIEMEENADEDFFAQTPSDENNGMTEDESLYEAQAYENNDDLESQRTQDDNEGLEEFMSDDGGNLSSDDSDDAEENDFSLQDSQGEENDFSGNDFLDYTAAPEGNFRDDLLLELNTCHDLSENFKKLCETLINHLDDNGLLTTPLADIAMVSESSIDETARALEFIQEFDPPGIAARSIQECWALQLKRVGKFTPAFEKMFSDFWDELINNRLNVVAQELGVSMVELQQMLELISTLSPYPIRAAKGGAQPVFPEMEIRPSEGGFAAFPLRTRRTFKLSKYAENTSPDAGPDFLAAVREGKLLMEALEYRKSTLQRIAEMIIDTQSAFLEEGPGKLKPFTMKQAAEYLDVSESTVSRAAAEKYIKTPQGVLPLKAFFTAGYVSDDGENVSRTADMELLKKLIDEEDKRKPLSDEKLSQLLNAAGHPVARRTVVKYREKMNIPNSSLRKEFF